MDAGSGKRLLLVWLVLSAVTLAQLAVGASGGRETLRPDAWIATGAIALALVKVRIILREFMEVRHAPALLRRLTDFWLALAGVGLLGSWLLGHALAAG